MKLSLAQQKVVDWVRWGGACFVTCGCVARLAKGYSVITINIKTVHVLERNQVIELVTNEKRAATIRQQHVLPSHVDVYELGINAPPPAELAHTTATRRARR